MLRCLARRMPGAVVVLFELFPAILAGTLFFSEVASGGDWVSGHDGTASLVAYDASPPDNRTPLILIHGYRGTLSATRPRPVWQNLGQFIRHWDCSGLDEAYKLYLFSYVSDVLPVGGDDDADTLATRLRDWIDIRTAADPGSEHRLPDVPLVIIGHSMGGLVARSMMEQTTSRYGFWRGRPGGERVLRLITLGTPHHGMPSANGSRISGCLYRETRPAWRPLSAVTGDLFWNRSGETAPSAPNRNELLWDNFNGSMAGCPAIETAEKNRLLPLTELFNDAIVAYGAFLPTTDPQRPSRLSRFIPECLDAVGVRENRILQLCNSVLGYEALSRPEAYGENDGFVPLRSSLFDGAEIAGRRLLADFDHDQIRGGWDFAPLEGNRYHDLYPALADDLNAVAFGARRIPDGPIRAPAQVTLMPAGPIEARVDIQWLLHDGTLLTERTPTVAYPQAGRFPVRMILRDPALGRIERLIEVVVLDPLITATPTRPDEFDWAFGVEVSPSVRDYRWTFGDGSEAALGASVDHTYAMPGFYAVEVALTLDDGTLLRGTHWLAVGTPDEIEVPAHRVGGAEIWPGGAVYRVRGLIQVAEGGHLDIREGAQVLLDPGAGFSAEGLLTARDVGFAPVDPGAPWSGIRFIGPGAEDSHLDGVAIAQSRGIPAGALVSIEDASPEISESYLDGAGARDGILIRGGAPLVRENEIRGLTDGAGIKVVAGAPIVIDNLITDSRVGIVSEAPGEGVYLHNDLQRHRIGLDVEYSESDRNAPRFEENGFVQNAVADVAVRGRIGARIEWKDAGTYRLDGGLEIGSAGRLDIGPGIAVQVTPGDALRAWGTLWANDVRFSAVDLGQPWQGILLSGPGSADSQLRDVMLRDAVGSQGDAPPHAAIHIEDSAPTLSGLDLQGDGAGVGIGIDGGRPAVSGSRLVAFDQAVRVWSGAPIVERMQMTGNAIGIALDAAATGSYRFNRFDGNRQYAMSAPAGAVGLIDASKGYWGDRSGPLDQLDDRAEGGLYNPGGRGDRVTDGIGYSPWVGMLQEPSIPSSP